MTRFHKTNTLARPITSLSLSLLAFSCADDTGGDPAQPGPDLEIHVPDPGREPADVLAEYVRDKGLPAAAILALGPNGVLASELAGTRKAGSGVPVQAGDAFHLGSDTKAMTALLCAMAVDEGKLSWTGTVADSLGAEASGNYATVTLEQLLSHTSGIPDLLPDVTWLSFFANWLEPVEGERDRMARAALSLAPVSFRYSNFNYVVAARMLETAYSLPWETLMKERLFVPLGMKGAGFGPPNASAGVEAPWGHSPDPVPYGPFADNPPALGPAGTVHANLEDMAAYLRFILSGGIASDGKRLVSEDSFASIAATRPGSGNYGLGWVVLTDPSSGLVLAHDGSNTTFYCSICVFLDAGYAVAAFTNRGDEEVAYRVTELTAYLGQKYKRAD
jgi:D-alanyl-D-alanine carboxypeptidase